MGTQTGPSMNRSLSPGDGWLGKLTLLVLFAAQQPRHWSPSFLGLCLVKCSLAAPESFPIYLNLSLPSQPNSRATSSWKPAENSHSAPFSSHVNVPRGPHCPIPARLLDHSSLPLEGRPLGRVT